MRSKKCARNGFMLSYLENASISCNEVNNAP